MRSTEDVKPGPTLITTPQVERAFQAQKDLLNSREIGELVDKGLVREIVVDPTTIPVSLEVNVKGGTYDGIGSAEYVEARVPRIYEGIAVRVSTERPDRKTPAFGVVSDPSQKSK